MSKRKPAHPPSPITLNDRPERITQTRRYRLITPLFGGGVEPGQADPVTIVRASGIRGHLRFWWRATRGGAFGNDVKKLKAAEDALWGAASGEDGSPSLVEVVVYRSPDRHDGRPFAVPDRKDKSGQRQIPIGDPRSPYSYAAFRLRDMPGAQVLEGVEFTLEITFPQNRSREIQAALWAWETFGGIGARTRRGFGALQCISIVEGERELALEQPAHPEQVSQWIIEQARQLNAPASIQGEFLHFGANLNLSVTRPRRDALERWRHLIQQLKEFRSSQKHLWPEPDAVRRLAGHRFKGRRHDKHIPAGRNVFPRAAFGLPIIFHFKDDSDPDDTTLEGASHKRYGSRLFMRPLACADEQFVGLALVLDGPELPPDGLRLRNAPGDPPVEAQLNDQEARMIEPLNSETDVLRAFLRYLDSKGQQK